MPCIKVYIGIKNSDDSYELAANYTPTSEVSSVMTNDMFGRYLKLVVTAPAYAYFKVAEIEAYGKLYEGELPEEPIFASINISSGFNVDVVAEATPVSGLFSDGLDDQGWILYGANVHSLRSVWQGNRLFPAFPLHYHTVPGSGWSYCLLR